MRFGWIGYHMEGLPALRAVLNSGIRLEGVISLKPELAAQRSGHQDYAAPCRASGVGLYYISNINDREALVS